MPNVLKPLQIWTANHFTLLANAFLKSATKNQARRMHWHMVASFAINVLLRTTPTSIFHFT